ncbi:MAG: glycosyltransferase, partial [bacterium]
SREVPGDDPPRAAVAVAARDEGPHIPALLSALQAQDYPPGSLQVVLADDGSTDRTRDLLTSPPPGPHEVTALHLDLDPAGGSPKKRALARAIASTGAPLLLLTDADTVPPPRWARIMAAALDGGCPVVGGYSPGRPRKGILGLVAGSWELGTAALAGGFAGLGRPLHMSGRNWGFRRGLYEEAGGYAGLEDALSGDDTLLAQKMAARAPSTGWGFTLDPDLTVPTHPPEGWSHFLSQRRRHAATGKRFRPAQLLLAALSFLVFAFLWVGLITFPWAPWGRGAVGAALFLKLGTDTAALTWSACRAGEGSLIPFFPLFSLLHLFFFPVIQAAGTLLPFRWKGRRGR